LAAGLRLDLLRELTALTRPPARLRGRGLGKEKGGKGKERGKRRGERKRKERRGLTSGVSVLNCLHCL